MLFITLALLLSFATVNATLFSPALPELTQLFQVSENSMEAAVLLFLVGYCFGQLFYSPLENRFGRTSALFIGIIIQIVSLLALTFIGISLLMMILVIV